MSNKEDGCSDGVTSDSTQHDPRHTHAAGVSLRVTAPPCPLLPSPQHVEVCGVCARQDRRAESEGPQPEAARHLGLHLPPAAVWGAAAQAPDPAQGSH